MSVSSCILFLKALLLSLVDSIVWGSCHKLRACEDERTRTGAVNTERVSLQTEL